ncbi:AmpG family muropeptide MFS transporter [Psychrobacter cryohalolentis]|uniref:Major facilitator superfamily MFS_1 n=1 Tax=Psychrobacter cryohalolentis (strain ATCC BAA-1226 / DSM 17306 / VKM B-2378 / K5) TaxID=335284 RepID=Q1QBL6_PSYCK|nr:MFS transporter [Psychrobacter cryohalolentis]ABE74937.1 major facilitator superfamily MFS_1 [Psychrobacter cryohalolentis K5]ASE25146.1 MFS transporter [Psychrobacter cryohalolentis]
MSAVQPIPPNSTIAKKSLSESLQAYLDRRSLIMLFLGFVAGIPILLIFSSLSLWLREAGIDRSVVTMFSWAALGYAFKFIWAPLIDAVPLPILTKLLGRRRSWILVSQIMIIAAICIMASVNPANEGSLVLMAVGAVLLGFSSATQDIVIDAYRIELAPPSLQAVLSAMYVTGYRIGMIVAGAGALYLADYFGSTESFYSYEAWRNTYWIMAAVMGIGVITTLVIHEPIRQQVVVERKTSEYTRLVLVFAISVIGFVLVFANAGLVLPETESVFAGFLIEVVRMVSSLAAALIIGYSLVKANLVEQEFAKTTWIEPIADFFRRYGKKALLLLALIGLYRISDIVAGVISNVFYQDMAFTKVDIANAVKLVGVVMAIAGGFLGGLLAQKMRIMRAMMVGAVLACVTNLLFILLTYHPGSLPYMYLAVILDNLAAGLASAVFIAFLSALTSIRFTAVQYSIFSSLMTLLPKVVGGYSGTIVDSTSYPFFFMFTFLIGIPILALIYYVDKYIVIGDNDDIYGDGSDDSNSGSNKGVELTKANPNLTNTNEPPRASE